MSYCICQSAHRGYFAERARLLNSQVRTAQSVMRLNGFAWRSKVSLSTDHGTARHFLLGSVRDFCSPIFGCRWLAYAKVFLTIS